MIHESFAYGNNVDALFKQVQEGDEVALERLFRVYFSRLNDFASRITRDSETAQDIIQEVFIHLWEKRTHINGQNIEAYLFRMVRNRCLDYIKHLKVIDNYNFQFESTAYYEELYRIDFIRDEPYVLIEQELKQEIEKVIYSLPERCREVFILSRIQGLKNKEIALKLGINVKNVERHITHALKVFKEQLATDVPVALIVLVCNSLIS